MGAAVLALAFACVAATAVGTEQDRAPVPVTLGAGSRLWLEGTSTMHDYESGTSQVTVRLHRDAAAAAPQDVAGLDAAIRSGQVRGVEVEVPVLSLKSKKSGLDKNLWKALQAEQHPSIRFRLEHYTIATTSSSSDTLRIRAEGTLQVAGVSRPDTLDARAYRHTDGVWLEGSEPLLMSDFGIRPPTMMMGTLRVKDRVVVRYRLLLRPESDVSNSGRSN
jgi:hypothetical protein